MREIKFRAWSTKDKKMYHFDDKHLIVMGRQNRWSFGEPSWDWEMEEGTDETDGILMQYTGLKDVNGKEIYEGDIVRYIDSLYHKTIHQIIWNDYYACFSYKPYKFIDNGGDDDATLSYTRKFEIIGNIYENPELLDPNKIDFIEQERRRIEGHYESKSDII